MGNIIFVAREVTDGETRVAASFETVKKMKGFGFDVVVETGAGAASRIPDTEFEAAGARIGGFADAASADVVREDRHVDEEFRGTLRQLITFMMEDPRTISMSIEILFIAKAIERIGDHAKNISEYVIYLVKGKDVRHVTLEEIEREVLG